MGWFLLTAWGTIARRPSVATSMMRREHKVFSKKPTFQLSLMHCLSKSWQHKRRALGAAKYLFGTVQITWHCCGAIPPMFLGIGFGHLLFL